MDKPLASIIINNYNYGKFLNEAIDSALNQTYLHTEVVVVDDGSTDNSRDIIKSYGDKIVPVLKPNGGQASAFNAGFAASRGDIICFLDSDDIFMHEKVAEVVDTFEAYPDTGWCYHTVKVIDIKGRESIEGSGLWLPSGRHKLLSNSSKDWLSESDLRESIKKGNLNNLPCCPSTSGLCFRRSLLRQILPMPEVTDISLNDTYVKFTAVALGKGFALGKELAVQRIHGDNAFSFRKDKQQIKARIHILTAYWMRRKFPFISKFANNLFAVGLGTYWCTGGIEAASQEVVQSYLSSLFFWERLEINFRAFYHYLK